MRKCLLVVVLAVLVEGAMQSQADAWIGFGINVGIPVYRPYPCYGPYPYPYYYGGPYVYAPPVYVAPNPVVYQPTPVAPVPAQPPQVLPAPIPVVSQPTPPPSAARSASYSEPAGNAADADRYVQQLGSPDERTRSDSAIELGKMHADRAVEALIAMLTSDKSSQVRETAARALGLIAAPRSLNALQQAALADNDRDVRHSAQFSAELIRANLRRN